MCAIHVATQLPDGTLFPFTLKRSWTQLLSEPSSSLPRDLRKHKGLWLSNLRCFAPGFFEPFLWRLLSCVVVSFFVWICANLKFFVKQLTHKLLSTSYEICTMVAIFFQGVPPLGGRVGFHFCVDLRFLSPPPPLLSSDSGICFTYRTRYFSICLTFRLYTPKAAAGLPPLE